MFCCTTVGQSFIAVYMYLILSVEFFTSSDVLYQRDFFIQYLQNFIFVLLVLQFLLLFVILHLKKCCAHSLRNFSESVVLFRRSFLG